VNKAAVLKPQNIFPFFAFAKPVTQNQIFSSLPVKRTGHCAADKTCRTSYKNHDELPFV
jgi:hypothetical protein